MIAPLGRFSSNPLVRSSDISFTRATGTFNPGATIDHASGRVVLLVRVYDESARRSCLALALSSNGERIDEIWDRPAISPEASYEEWGVEDPRITWLRDERRYAVTYTGHSPNGPRVCLITTDDLLAPDRYVRHGPRIPGENKNCVVFPEKIDGQYVILHRPMPNIVCVRVSSVEDEWPASGTTLVGPQPNTWRSSRVGAGSPPIRTRIGWLLPFHGATTIEEGNVYSMGWCVLDLKRPEKVRYVSDTPALTPEAEYEIELGKVPQVDHANFITGIRVVFPEGMVELGDELLVYYGAADVAVAGARVKKRDLVDSIESAIEMNQGGVPL
ncbi:MAG TPA: hypothetical protein VES88_13690 [Gemmatimonadaceae bacterium]|nr:hypothetical protein [Gemmatimonadaceae bacterium]